MIISGRFSSTQDPWRNSFILVSVKLSTIQAVHDGLGAQWSRMRLVSPKLNSDTSATGFLFATEEVPRPGHVLCDPKFVLLQPPHGLQFERIKT